MEFKAQDRRKYEATRAGCGDCPLCDSRTITVQASPAAAFVPIRRIGGDNGWYAYHWLWRLRGALDRVTGGVGLRSGRPHPDLLREGDPVDFWRVERFEADHYLRLVGEMRLPGKGWLEFEVTPQPSGARIRQTALFEPSGLAGRLYWYTLYPFHHLIFGAMLKRIARAAERSHAGM